MFFIIVKTMAIFHLLYKIKDQKEAINTSQVKIDAFLFILYYTLFLRKILY